MSHQNKFATKQALNEIKGIVKNGLMTLMDELNVYTLTFALVIHFSVYKLLNINFPPPWCQYCQHNSQAQISFKICQEAQSVAVISSDQSDDKVLNQSSKSIIKSGVSHNR